MQVMARLEAAHAKPAAAALPQTAQAGPCTPDAGFVAIPEQPQKQQQQQQQQQQQPSCAPSQAEYCHAALPITRNGIQCTAELDGHASGCSAIGTLPTPCTVKNAGYNGSGALQTQLHSLPSAMEMDAGPEAQDRHAEGCTVGAAEEKAIGNRQLEGQVQAETGGLAVANSPSVAGEAPGLSRRSGDSSEDASLANKGPVQEAGGDGVAPVAAGSLSEGMYPVGVTTYTEASASASAAERAGICMFCLSPVTVTMPPWDFVSTRSVYRVAQRLCLCCDHGVATVYCGGATITHMCAYHSVPVMKFL